ncbi:MAG: hypothetical protein ABR979_05810 [Halobacteriota archaeon]|jgi:hypothetical protein
MFEVIIAIQPIQIRKQPKFEEIYVTVAFSGLHELVEILVGESEAHAEVKKNARFLVFEKDFVSANLMDPTIESQ